MDKASGLCELQLRGTTPGYGRVAVSDDSLVTPAALVVQSADLDTEFHQCG
jgi:hypothetical protein